MRSCLHFWLVTLLVLASAQLSVAGLVFLEAQRKADADVSALGSPRAVAPSPDGAHVYVAASDDDSVVVFRRENASGRLTFVEAERDGVDGVDGIDGAHSVTVSPDGAYVYAAGSNDNALAVFAREGATGRLTLVQIVRNGSAGATGLEGVECVTLSPDGAHLYATAITHDALLVFRRDPASGTLAFVQILTDGGGVDGLNQPRSAVVSPDGAHVYVAGSVDNALAVFARNAMTGELTFVEVKRDGVDGVDGLGGAQSVALAPDGAHVYVAGNGDDMLAVFRRDVTTGTLTFVEVRRDGVDGVDGLNGAAAVTVGPDGQQVFVAGLDDDAVAVFNRNLVTGALTFAQVVHDKVRGISGLNGPRALALGPGGAHLYVAGTSDDALLVFSARCGDGTVDPGEQCDDANTVSGDGCSDICRHECTSRSDCNDGDRCTEDRCRGGECTSPRCGFLGAQCELHDVAPVIEGAPDCAGMSRTLRKMIDRTMRQARIGIQRAGGVPDPDGKKAYKAAKKLLVPVRATALRMAKRHRLSGDCQMAVAHALDALQEELKVMLRRKGVCAP